MLECSFQKVWRIERGAVPVRGPDVKVLCQAYNATADMTEALVGLARETKAKGWWQSYGDAVPDWFELYVGLESAATRLRKFELSMVPGLLQARAYMEAVLDADNPNVERTERERLISIKTERQGLLSRHFPPPPRLDVILSEAVLWAAPSTPGAMTQQLWHLLKANELPHVCVRVLPSAVGPHWASRSGAFTILEFPTNEKRGGEPPTIYSEFITGALYLDKPKEIAAYEQAWSIVEELALSVEESGQMIQKIMREMNHRE